MADIKHAIDIAAAPNRIYPLVSTGDGFRLWWAADVTVDGVVELGFFGRETVYRLRLEIDRPGSRAVWVCESGREWQGTRLHFELEPNATGTRLRFTHAEWSSESDYFVSCNTTWGGLLFRLKSTAEGKATGPLFSATGMLSRP